MVFTVAAAVGVAVAFGVVVAATGALGVVVAATVAFAAGVAVPMAAWRAESICACVTEPTNVADCAPETMMVGVVVIPPVACAIFFPTVVLKSTTVTATPYLAAALFTIGSAAWHAAQPGCVKNVIWALLVWADATPVKAMNVTINTIIANKPICFLINFWHLFVMIVFLTY